MSAFPPSSILPLLTDLTTLLHSRAQTLCVAETAAGGLISSCILSTPGASKIYKGGLVLYTLESRIAFAGWTEEDVKAYRGPSEEVVKGLAENARGRLGGNYCVCESGTAGPTGGGTRNRTPGYVALAVATGEGTVTKEVETGLGGDREGNMVKFAEEALGFLRDVIRGDVKVEGSRM